MQTIKLAELFPSLKSGAELTKEYLNLLNFEPHLAEQFAKHLHLAFLEEDNPQGSNVCFLSSEEVMPSYRMHFQKKDLIHCLYVILKAKSNTVGYLPDTLEIQLPQTADEFWSLVEKGKRLN